MKKRVALIFGVTGQDGSYLTELLLKKGYFVHGMIRRASTFNTARVNHLFQEIHKKGRKFFMYYGDLADAGTIRKIIYKVKPHEIYNLAAQSHVKVSFEIPEYTMDITGNGALRILEAIRDFQLETGRKVFRCTDMPLAAGPGCNEVEFPNATGVNSYDQIYNTTQNPRAQSVSTY